VEVQPDYLVEGVEREIENGPIVGSCPGHVSSCRINQNIDVTPVIDYAPASGSQLIFIGHISDKNGYLRSGGSSVSQICRSFLSCTPVSPEKSHVPARSDYAFGNGSANDSVASSDHGNPSFQIEWIP
jgi:hypothetical protein